MDVLSDCSIGLLLFWGTAWRGVGGGADWIQLHGLEAAEAELVGSNTCVELLGQMGGGTAQLVEMVEMEEQSKPALVILWQTSVEL